LVLGSHRRDLFPARPLELGLPPCDLLTDPADLGDDPGVLRRDPLGRVDPVDDVVEAILATVERLETSRFAGPINIGAEGRLTILELAREAIAVAEKAIEIDFLPGEPSVWGQAVDCSKARQLLGGWQPRVPLREGLRKTYEFVREKLTREDGTQ